MRRINEHNLRISTILAFILIPLSGLATDVYLPSFPEMAEVFHTSSAGIQQTLVFFLVSYGIAQFFAGSILDSFGRYRLNLLALFILSASNFVIIFTHQIHVVDLMRAIQGICTAFIMVGKRALFVDAYTGEKQRHYTSLLTIVWSVAPIVAPFLGGYLQKNFGWTSNFYLLGFYALIMLLLEAIFSGESLNEPHPFRLPVILKNYRKLLGTPDFSAGVFILGSIYTTVMVFNMSVPFIVEQRYHLSPVVTGYCALFSGVAMFIGGLAGKMLHSGSLYKRLVAGNLIQGGLILLMFISASLFPSLIMIMVFVLLIHMTGGFLYNLLFTYCITRFPRNAGMAGGITSGGSYMITSVASSGILGLIAVTDQQTLAISYLVFALLTAGILGFLRYVPAGRLLQA
ncbi:MFS transporter [Compostibacter hankyongensis]|uniref:MFS transporter n=2 Tax=Compostibacter hankyongensis TaxID=1007089 RepID=A0ABP8FMW5_9BACT